MLSLELRVLFAGLANLFCNIINHSMTGPLGNNFPSNLKVEVDTDIDIGGSQNSLFHTGLVIKCKILHINNISAFFSII